MRIKSKALIESFKTKNITEKTLEKNNNSVIFINSPDYDIDELLTLLSTFDGKIHAVSFSSFFSEKIEETILRLPDNIRIALYSLNKEQFEQLSEEAANKLDSVGFSHNDPEMEMMDIGLILAKFKNADTINYPFQIGHHNISNFEQAYNLAFNGMMITSVDPDFLKEFKEYCEKNFDGQEGRPDYKTDIVFGSRSIFSNLKIDLRNAINEKKYTVAGITMQDLDDIEIIKKNLQGGKKLEIIAANMVDVPLEMAKRIKSEGINCQISFYSADNNYHQNATYDLDEYIAISEKMQELIGDIDDNLPEEEKFRIIYERVASSIVYDQVAGYPTNKKERQYSEENRLSCRNLKNGLLYGKAVCAGYADILKNACLLKGIECEYARGPVDSYIPMDDYLSQKEHDGTMVYRDNEGVIEREYHAWNKVRINGQWYNVDPTWDRSYILNDVVPNYAFLSDATLKKLGRPTVKHLKNPCDKDMDLKEKGKIFDPATKEGDNPSRPDTPQFADLLGNSHVMQFEETVDRFGDPPQLPVPIKNEGLLRILRAYRKMLSTIRNGISDSIYSIRKMINPNFDKTEEIPTLELDDEKTDTLPSVQEDDEKTDKLPIVELTDEKPNEEVSAKVEENKWKLDGIFRKKVEEVGKRQDSPSDSIHNLEEINNDRGVDD